MKRILLKLILVLCLALGLQTSVKAQLVYIPDSAFRAQLNIDFGSCMVGDSIDPNCPDVLNATNINMSSNGIIDLTGIEVFVNLDSLYCSDNSLSSLPQLPAGLKLLHCSNNLFTTFGSLPNTLQEFYCSKNQLSSLPSLPPLLKILDCYDNYLPSLPTFPASLTNLYCGYNQLTNLPTLPDSIIEVGCYGNHLLSLPALPASLVNLFCEDNNLTSIPTLPANLNELRCNNNQLISLPSLPNSLTRLKCYDNQLVSLPLLPISLDILDCKNNQITSLPTLPDSLTILYCNNNPLNCLPNLNNVGFLNFSNTFVNCLPNYGVVTHCNPPLSSIPLCDLFNSNSCEVFWNIEGTTYVDADSNCVFGTLESGYMNQKINLYKNGVFDQQTYTRLNGNYEFNASTFGIYTTELDTTGLPLEIDCPVTGFYTDTISATDSLKYDRDFALKCKGVDLAATSIYSLPLTPARLRTIKIQSGDLAKIYGYNCANGISGSIAISITGACNYVSSPIYSLTPTSVIGNVLTYSIADFGAISYDSTFDFNLLVDTTAALGSQICITVSVITSSTEINYTNNQTTQCFTVVGSFDPNDKAVYPQSIMEVNSDRWLNYTVRFQNTGTADAENIFITDTLSSLLDISTFTLLSYSHEPFVQLYNDGLLKFNFPNIHLPDSNSNEQASHGYAQFKIRAKDSLVLGSTIDNTANIFFDFNAPVITNTTSNLLINCSLPKTILNATICGGEAYVLNGQEYYNSGVYQQNILTAFGCDSVVELRLTVNTINNDITQSAGTLQTSAAATNYQWINCTTGTSIVGANTQSFNPTQSGNYAVVVDFGTCTDTSTCFYFSTVGINEINPSNISIQPNPFNNELKVTLDKSYNGVLEVYNTIGALITSERLQGRNVTLNTSTWNPGVYILKVATNDGVVVKKVVKR